MNLSRIQFLLLPQIALNVMHTARFPNPNQKNRANKICNLFVKFQLSNISKTESDEKN